MRSRCLICFVDTVAFEINIEMATDELSSKLSRRLQIEEGAEEPVAVEAGQGHEKAATANADSELGVKLMRRGELNDGVGEHHQPSMKVFNPYTEFKEFSRKQIKDMERMFKHLICLEPGVVVAKVLSRRWTQVSAAVQR
ncbi:hypothetical protein J4Q44_G00255730 [Coregonus suidteri]|uniref:Uncharacterized protein n=1 Tax=Coregonus suidteri TaxID=861788 RepID=A0AAN8L786_9TELE